MTSQTQAALKAIREVAPTKMAARLRPLMPEIDRKLAEGARIADIHSALEQVGLEVSAATLGAYVARYRRAHRALSGDSVEAAPGSTTCSRHPQDSASKASPEVTSGDLAAVSHAAPLPHSNPPPASPAPSAEAGDTGAGTARIECTADPEFDDQSAPLHGSASPLSVHDALIAARKRVAATDYSKFARKTNQGRKSK